MSDPPAFQAVQPFTVRVLQNWKSKEKGAINLQKNAYVLVLAQSDDEERYFGEGIPSGSTARQKRGWFPTTHVRKEPHPIPIPIAPYTPWTPTANPPATAAATIVTSNSTPAFPIFSNIARPEQQDQRRSMSISAEVRMPVKVTMGNVAAIRKDLLDNRDRSRSLPTISAEALQAKMVGLAKTPKKPPIPSQNNTTTNNTNNTNSNTTNITNHTNNTTTNSIKSTNSSIKEHRRSGSWGGHTALNNGSPPPTAGGAPSMDSAPISNAGVLLTSNKSSTYINNNNSNSNSNSKQGSDIRKQLMTSSPAVMSEESGGEESGNEMKSNTTSPNLSDDKDKDKDTNKDKDNKDTDKDQDKDPENAGSPTLPVTSQTQATRQPEQSDWTPVAVPPRPLEGSKSIGSTIPDKRARFARVNRAHYSTGDLSFLDVTSAGGMSVVQQTIDKKKKKWEEREKEKKDKQERKENREKEKEQRKMAKAKKKKERKKNAKSAPELSLFGLSLEELMELQRQDHPLIEVPLILLNFCHALIFMGGHHVEGIFRISGNAAAINELKEEINNGDYTSDFQDPHNASSLLKLWLSSLPQPVIPNTISAKCLEAALEPELSIKVLDEFPPINRKVLCYIVQFLQQHVLPERATTKMDEDNLAMAFAAVLFSQESDTTDLMKALKDTQLQKLFINQLITHMKFPTPLNFREFEDAVRVIKIKKRALKELAKENKKKKIGRKPPSPRKGIKGDVEIKRTDHNSPFPGIFSPVAGVEIPQQTPSGTKMVRAIPATSHSSPTSPISSSPKAEVLDIGKATSSSSEEEQESSEEEDLYEFG